MREGKGDEMKLKIVPLISKAWKEVETVENHMNYGFKLTMLLLLPIYVHIWSTYI